MANLPPCISPECLKKINQLNNDNEVKKAVDQHLRSQGNVMDNIKDTLARTNNFIADRANQIKKKTDIEKYKAEIVKLKAKMTALPGEYQTAEKNYLNLTGWSWPNKPEQKYTGDAAYQNKKFYDYLQEANKKKTLALQENKTVMDRLHTLVDSYKTGLIYSNKMNDLLQIKENEYVNIKKAMSEMRDVTLTNDRRVFYEDKERESLLYNRYILFYFLYGIFVLYFILGNKGLTIKTLRTEGFYKNKSFWMIVCYDIIYLTIPLWINYFVIAIFRIYNQIKYMFHNKAPRNVYSSL